MPEAGVCPQVASGDRIARSWTVERFLAQFDGILALQARSAAGGRAVCFVLPADAPDPSLDPNSARAWGTARTVLRDDRFGRVVVDEVVDGSLLKDRLEDGHGVIAGLIDDLTRRARDEHRRGSAHGQIKPEFIIVGPEGPQVAGWGLGGGEHGDRAARDLADLAALAGAVHSGFEAEPHRADDSGPVAGVVAALHSAIVAEHLPTLRKAVTQAETRGDAVPRDELIRARDALRRMERRVESCLQQARDQLLAGDPLGAVASCRDAVRLGAEAEAEPLLRQARRQAREMLAGGRPSVSLRNVAICAASVLAVASLLWLLGIGPWRSPDSEVERQLARIENDLGRRAAVRYLIALRDRGELPGSLSGLVAGRMAELVAAERETLVVLRRDAIAQGARPRDADELAQQALDELDALTSWPIDQPGLETRLLRALARVDRAATVYMARTQLTVDQAVRGVEALIAEDPVFKSAAEGGDAS